MKRTIQLLLSIFILCVSYSFAFSQATLSIANVNGTAGNPVSVAVQATGISDMEGFQFTIVYDNTKLTYVSCSNWGGGTNSTAIQITSLSTLGKITFVYNDVAVNISSGKFFDINFTVNAGATGSSPVTWSDNPTVRELSNSIPVEITCNYTNGSVTFSSEGALITFNTGWGIFSSWVVPPPSNSDLKDLFMPRITDGSLIKIQDENGNSLEDMGVFGGWTNNIGNISPSEGYKVKMTTACSLSITGTSTPLPFDISLKTGWNIMGYPRNTVMDAKAVVQQLIDRKTLVKVQDELGNSIEDMGFLGGWVNNIGNFIPGKGYKIKVKANDILTFP
jgi:hypothetical protein